MSLTPLSHFSRCWQLTLALLSAACGGGGGGPSAPLASGSNTNTGGNVAAPPTSVARLISPTLTDPAITTFVDAHVAITPDPAATPKHTRVVQFPAPFHSSTVVDSVTPKENDGSPTYRPVWNYLCFP